MDELRFRSQSEKHELSALYEEKIKRMGNAGRNGGEYYTPRPLIRAMIRVVNPQLGETIYDGACGSGGFLCEAFDYLREANPNASVSLRKHLLESCDLHTVLDCPGGTFQGAGVKTVVLFFEKGKKTRRVWFYQLDPGRNLGKTNPLNDNDLADFVKIQKTFADSPKSWSVDAKDIDPATFGLSAKNPNGGETVTHRSPQEIMEEIARGDAECAEVLENIRKLLK